jgi:hypothetical protein
MLLNAFGLYAGDSARYSSQENKLKFELSAGNTFVHQYRAASGTRNPYLSPYFEARSKSGLWMSGTAYRVWGLQEATRDFPEADISAGWDHDIDTFNNYSLYYSHSFYDRQVELLASALSNFAGFYYEHDFTDITTGLRLEYGFGNQTAVTKRGKKKTVITTYPVHDIYFSLENSYNHYWEKLWKKNDELDIDPEIDILAGTGNSYSEYVLKTHPGKKAAADKVSAFRLQQAIFEMPVTYYLGQFHFTPEADFYLPFYVSSDAGIKPFALFTATVAYTLKKKDSD